MTRHPFLVLCVLAAAALSSACGGGGDSPPQQSVTSLFLSDTFAEDYSQVWVAVTRVELRNATSGIYSLAFEDPSGVLLDAGQLRDVQGPRFAYLGGATLPQGTYDRLRITLQDRIVLVASGNTTGTMKTFDASLPRDQADDVQLSYGLAPPLRVDSGSSTHEVIDVNLAGFSLNGAGEVVPSVRRGSDLGIQDTSRHEREDYHGVVSDLTATTFLLIPASGKSISVSYDSTTPVFSRRTGLDVGLAEGQRVEVQGIFSLPERTLIATSIMVLDGTQEHAEAHGTPTEVDLVENTMLLTDIYQVEGFVPQGSTVNVEWTDATVFRRAGDIVDETWLSTFPYCEVAGLYVSATNTILAFRINLEDDGGDGLGQPEVHGTSSAIDLVGNTLVLGSLHSVVGFTPQGPTLVVSWTDQTVFRRGGDVVDETWLANFPDLEAKGTFDSSANTFHATRITLEDSNEQPLPEGMADATGTIGTPDLSGNTLLLSNLTAVEGFLPPGGTITVTWSQDTVFRYKGAVVDENAVLAHDRADVRGTYDPGSTTLAASRIELED